MPNFRGKKAAFLIFLIIAECVGVSWALVTYVGYHTPMGIFGNSVLAAVVLLEIIFLDGGARGQESERVQPYVEN